MSDRQSIPERLGHDFLKALYHMIKTRAIIRIIISLSGRVCVHFSLLLMK